MNEQKPVSAFSRLKSIVSGDSPTEQTTQGMGATQGSGAVAAAVSEAKAEVKKRRGRGPAASTAASADVAEPSKQEALNKLQADLDKLFAPEMWRPIVTLPALTMQTLTGHPHWEIKKEEGDHLALAASTAMRYASITNPAALAVALFSVQMIMVYAPRVLKEIQVRKLEKEEAFKSKSQ